MERGSIQAWLSGVDRLSDGRKVGAGEVFADRPADGVTLTAVEMGVGEDRVCSNCGVRGAVANDKSRGLQHSLPIQRSKLRSSDGYTSERPAQQ